MNKLSRRQIVLVGVAAFGAAAIGFVFWSVLPTLNTALVPMPTRVLARDGSVLYELNAADQETASPMSLFSMPSSLVNAVLSAEDKRFYEHHGIDWLATARALKDSVLAGKIVSGGSTIEQQLIKNTFFADASRSLIQKAREMVAARWWSITHSKEESLERYLNTVYLGNNLFGIQTAAHEYFHKEAADLSVSETAYLAGIIAAPSRFEPVSHRDAGFKRQRYVLTQMVENGFLPEADLESYASTSLSVFRPRHEIRAPHFVFRVLGLLESDVPDIATGGYEILTTLDPELQTFSEASVSHQLVELLEENATNAAVVAVDPITGDVLVYVGSAGYWSGDAGAVNMANAPRQPGSALKPFMYHAAIMNEIVTPATIIADLPVRFDIQSETGENGSYVPRNYNYQYHGPVSVRDALGSSLNIPAVKVLDNLGLHTFFETLSTFGLTFPNTPEYYGLGIVLGGGEVTLEDATSAYVSLATGNLSVPMRFVLEVRDRHGQVIKTFDAQPTHLFDPHEQLRAVQATSLITDILSDASARSISFGEASSMDIGKPVAIKTGTTKDFRDNWVFGYTSNFTLGVWVGNADNSPMYGVSGVSGAVPIWHDITAFRFRYEDPPTVDMPEGIISAEICVTSGMRTTTNCPKTRTEKFISGSEPTIDDTWYQSLIIDVGTGTLATNDCLDQTIEKIFLIPPPEYHLWITSADFEQPPLVDCEGRRTVFTELTDKVIISPLDGETIEISSHIDPDAQRIPFVASSSCVLGCRWFLNGETILVHDSVYLWYPVPGHYTLSLEGADGQVNFVVK